MRPALDAFLDRLQALDPGGDGRPVVIATPAIVTDLGVNAPTFVAAVKARLGQDARVYIGASTRRPLTRTPVRATLGSAACHASLAPEQGVDIHPGRAYPLPQREPPRPLRMYRRPREHRRQP